VSFSNGVWSKTPVEIYLQNIRSGVYIILIIFRRINWPNWQI